MIKTKTVFVVGAGASDEVGFPLGRALAREIADALDFKPASSHSYSAKELARSAILNLTQRPTGEHRGRVQELFGKALTTSGGLATAPSIDTFIDNHSPDPDIGLLGKLAIAACLIEAERRSPICPKRIGEAIDLTKLSGTWFEGLFQILADGVKANAAEALFENVAFIVFNYDRCVELYLEQAIANRFFKDLRQAREIVRKNLAIVHPYGSLGMLGGGAVGFEFGIQFTEQTFAMGDAIVKMAESLRTFTEAQTGDEGHVIKQYLCEAERVVFLGSAFHSQNLELLTTKDPSVTDYRATAYGMSKSSQTEVLRKLSILFPHAGQLANSLHACKCAQLIADEHHYLSR